MDVNDGLKTITDNVFMFYHFSLTTNNLTQEWQWYKWLATWLYMMNTNHLDKYHIIKLFWRHIEGKMACFMVYNLVQKILFIIKTNSLNNVWYENFKIEIILSIFIKQASNQAHITRYQTWFNDTTSEQWCVRIGNIKRKQDHYFWCTASIETKSNFEIMYEAINVPFVPCTMMLAAWWCKWFFDVRLYSDKMTINLCLEMTRQTK